MKNLVLWAVSNRPAMNLLMITVIFLGIWAMQQLNRETFPNFDLEMISSSVSYPGATPEEVEESVCQKIEESVRDIRGIKKITSSASEGIGSVNMELDSNVDDANRVLNEVTSAVGRIPSFPEQCERPETRLLQIEETILRVGVLGPPDNSISAQLALREVAERIRKEILDLPEISQANITGAKDFQIDVEFDEDTLRSYGLTLGKVANIIRQENYQMPGGTIRAKSQEILLRADNKREIGEEIAKLPLIGTEDGAKLTVGDLGVVRDEFVDSTTSISIRSVGSDTDRPFLAVSVLRNPSEDLLGMVDAVLKYVKGAKLPEGYDILTWGDRSVEVRERLEMLLENGVQGLIIVFICLSLFLDLRLAFWVALGIPFSLFGTCLYMYYTGDTLNMVSMFSFIMALGIVVDDSIVIGENIYAHRERGESTREAAINGALEVIPSVISSVSTTILAFMPLLFVSGMMGKFMFTLPMVVICMLTVSLFEAMTVLPCHLSHKDNLIFRILRTLLYLFRWVVYILRWASKYTSYGLDRFINSVYRPLLDLSLRYRSVFVALSIGVLLLSFGMVKGGLVPFVFFPRLDGNNIVCNLQFPNGTPESVTASWAKKIEDSFWTLAQRLKRENEGRSIFVHTIRTEGSNMSGRAHGGGGAAGGGSSHLCSVEVELVDSTERKIPSYEITDRWRKEVGIVPGAEVLTFDSAFSGPGGKAIEFKLVAPSSSGMDLTEVVERCKEKLGKYEGVYDVRSDNLPGKWEFQPRVKESATSLGVRQADIADALRNAYYGAEVMRLQRGRHEVKLMVRYPESARRSIASFDELRIRMDDGVERPIGELADVAIKRGYSTINRISQQRAVTITASVDDTVNTANRILSDMKGEKLQAGGSDRENAFFPKLFKEYPNVSIYWEGQAEQEQESITSLIIGFFVALMAMFVLLAVEFKSYGQPMIILMVIPFGIIGAILGHWAMGLQLTFFSTFGMVALSGIIINDSIVLIDFINRLRLEGKSVHEACHEAGINRFRAVLLTSVTTVGGLAPILMERSFQAKMLIPMAVTIAAGVMVSTVLVLFLVPVLYSLYDEFQCYMTEKFQLQEDD